MDSGVIIPNEISWVLERAKKVAMTPRKIILL